jgi:hypothetical protein
LVSTVYYLTKKSYLNKCFDVFTPTGRCCLAMTYLCIKMCIERRPLLSNSTQNSSIMTERRKKHACVSILINKIDIGKWLQWLLLNQDLLVCRN